MGNSPLVSIIMPAYNASGYIRQAIASVQAQTHTNWVLHIVDDCSTDDTPHIIRQAAREDERIRPIFLEKNGGVAHARNLALDACQGEYIAFLDSDDLWYPNKLSLQTELAQSTGADMVYCSYDMEDDKAQRSYEPFLVPEETDLEGMLARSVMSCSTTLLKKETCGHERFDSGFYHEDYVFWLSLLRQGCTARGIREPLAMYRIIVGSRSHNKLKVAKERWKVFTDYLHLPFFKAAWAFAQYALCGIRKYY